MGCRLCFRISRCMSWLPSGLQNQTTCSAAHEVTQHRGQRLGQIDHPPVPGIRVLSVSEQISFWRRSREELRFSETTRGKTALLHISPYANWIHLAGGHARTPLVTNERLRTFCRAKTKCSANCLPLVSDFEVMRNYCAPRTQFSCSALLSLACNRFATLPSSSVPLL